MTFAAFWGRAQNSFKNIFVHFLTTKMALFRLKMVAYVSLLAYTTPRKPLSLQRRKCLTVATQVDTPWPLQPEVPLPLAVIQNSMH